MSEQKVITPAAQRLGEMGLENFAPYLMNRIMGRYNVSPFRDRDGQHRG